MSILNEEEIKYETIIDVAKKMMIAARTAPKARGIDHLKIMMAESETIAIISQKMKEIGREINSPTFLRDAENITQSTSLILIGTEIKTMGLKKCGLCGFPNCEAKEKHADIPCVFNTGDLGIAMGSAVSIAMDNRIDNRIMYTIGIAVKELELMGKETKIIYGIPLSATSKNPFFDRKQF